MDNILCPVCGNLLYASGEGQLKCKDCQNEFEFIWDEDGEIEYLTNLTPMEPRIPIEAWTPSSAAPGDYLFEIRRQPGK